MDGCIYLITKTNNEKMKVKNLVSLIIVAIVAIVALCSLGRIGEDVKNEEIVINQMPFTGTMKYCLNPCLNGRWSLMIARH